MNNYEKEKIEFETNFREYKNKRIALYGIGRFTATLVPMLEDWNIVGLMDKNPDKIGTYVYGLPVLDITEVKEAADLIIINTSGTYWNLIFQRIKHIDIPIYYRNGEKAEDIEEEDNIEYWNSSFSQLRKRISSYDIISFDFFDTLFCRKTYLPSDIWNYVGDCLNDEQKKEKYLQLRKGSYAGIDKAVISISDIYETMDSDMSDLKNKEIELEKKFIIPRYIMVSLLKDILKEGKDIYIISDMYLPTEFFDKLLREQNIELPSEHILVSCDYGYTKKSGELWSKYKNVIVRDKKALHIGDNVESDIDICKKYAGIDTYFIMSQEEMLHRSAIKKCLPYINCDYHNMVLGLCISRLFNNPFSICSTRGKIKIDKREDFGYCVLGPIIFTFVCWLFKSVESDSIHQLCFLGRDGFFLKQDFEYLCGLMNPISQLKVSYLETSRQILMCADIEDENDFEEYIQMPYEGRLDEFFEDRLQIKLSAQDRKTFSEGISMPQDYEVIKKIIPKYINEIKEYIKATKKRYLKYLKSYELQDGDAVVDLGFYGTTQHYLSKILDKEFIGYYIVANKSDSNILAKKQILKSCTRVSYDQSCVNSFIHSMMLAIESFLTSPHGMVRGIGQNGQVICAQDTDNQKFFEDKIEINEGIKFFIKDMVDLHLERLKKMHIDDFIDNWYGMILKNSYLSEDVKRSFCNDNAFIHRRQERIFGDS